MHQLLKQSLLPFTVFTTGACVLIIEIVATRMLAPYFGNTIYSVSSVISVVLAALSVGYWYGGRLADRHPSKKLFFAIIAFSGVLVLCVQLLQASLLPTLGYRLPLDSGPLLVSLVLFFLPSFVLGMLSPFAIALQQRQAKQGVGTTAGTMFFFSTVGSIVGSLLAGFALIPFFGVSSIVLGVGMVLFLLGLIPWAVLGLECRLLVPLVLLAGSLLVVATSGRSSPNVLYSHDGLYERVTILDGTYRGRPARFLEQDASHSAAIYLDGDEQTYDYANYYALHQVFTPKVERALVLGGGAYSIPKALLRDLPEAKVDVAEIEPSLYDLSKQYFGLKDDPRLTNYVADGRRMLHDAPERYDFIFSDVYHSMYSIPSHMTTREFMQLVKSRLQPGGVFVANLIGSPALDGPSFIWSQVKTMQQVFPEVYVFAVRSPDEPVVQNIVVAASLADARVDVHDSRWRRSPAPALRELSGHYLDTTQLSLARYPIFTDNYAPVDFLAAQMLPKR